MRFIRQKTFAPIGEDGQKKIEQSIVAIIGCGALGSNSAEIMARSGIKKLVLIDNDKVDVSNLARQSLYLEKDLGDYKIVALKKRLEEINSNIEIQIYNKRLNEKNLDLLKSDIIIDGSDNLNTRFLVNRYARVKNIPFIFGSVIRSEGMVYPVIDSPCFECIFLKSKDFENCENQGIIASAPKVTSSMQCTLALKIIIGKKIEPKLFKFDLWKGDFQNIITKKNPLCTVCNSKKTDYSSFIVAECETKAMYKTNLKKRQKLNMRAVVNNFDVVEDGGIIVVIKCDGEEIIVHEYGELLFKSLKNTEKIKKIAKRIYDVA